MNTIWLNKKMGKRDLPIVDLAFLFSAQHGNFQRPVFDLTRLNAHINIPSGSMFVFGDAGLLEKLYNSQVLDSKAIRAVCSELTVSLQQQAVKETIEKEMASDYTSCL